MALKSLINLFYPTLCEGCGKPVGDSIVLCIGCSAELPLTGFATIPDNETAMRFAGRVHLANAMSLAWFTNDGLMQHLLHGLKYTGKKKNGLHIGRLIGDALNEAGWADDIEALIPVPLHQRKEALRGYNQSLVLCKGIAEITGLQIHSDALCRVKYTESQTHMTREERIMNMEAAFKVVQPEKIIGKHILLVDDVVTTGATLEACALALLSVAGVQVSIATAAIAV
ncbi:MAG: ComF family protein [Taibaiella sp.]|nr:ComF family protein [Taibaiella sp.]